MSFRARRAAASLGLAMLAGCAPRAPAPSLGDYRYVVVPPGPGAWMVAIEATLAGAPSARLASAAGDALDGVAVVTPQGTVPVARDGDAFVVPACRARCKIRYVVDLEALAARCHRMECARRIGDAVLGNAAVFLLLPEPAGDASIRVRVAGPNSGRFVTGLRRGADGDYVLKTAEVGEASFTAVGEIRRGRADVLGARVDVALLGAPLAMGDPAAAEFVRSSALRVAELYGRFPVDATVFVVPVAGANDVVFGRVMSLGGASVALLVGGATPAAGVRDNWVVVHELFHLSTPTFMGEGRWLEEGLATYYEPILRERAGWMTEAELWGHFVREMPRGLRADGAPASLEDRDDIDSTYWGGALYALLADVRIRVATHGARSLDDALRASLAQIGDATHGARVADFVRVGDGATGTAVLDEMLGGWAAGGANPDLGALWGDLGVAPGPEGKGVTLREDAPLASVRKAIAASTAH